MLNFNNSLFQVASFAALGLLTLENLGVDAKARRRDKNDYPSIQKAMKETGNNFWWKSYDLKTADDYELTMFRIVRNRRRKKVPNQW